MAETEAATERARRDLELARERQAAAGEAMASASASPHEFDRHRLDRDKAGADVERLELLIAHLEARAADERTAAKAQRRAELEAEAIHLEREIARLDLEGVAIARQLAGLVRGIEAARIRGMELNQWLEPRTIYATAAEPTRLYQTVAAITNRLRRACTFSKASMMAEQQLEVEEEPDANEAA
jgi:hypothetical protein